MPHGRRARRGILIGGGVMRALLRGDLPPQWGLRAGSGAVRVLLAAQVEHGGLIVVIVVVGCDTSREHRGYRGRRGIRRTGAGSPTRNAARGRGRAGT